MIAKNNWFGKENINKHIKDTYNIEIEDFIDENKKEMFSITFESEDQYTFMKLKYS